VLTAQENVAMPLILDGVSRLEAAHRGDPVLEKVGLRERKMHRPAELSGGEQQRVAIFLLLVLLYRAMKVSIILASLAVPPILRLIEEPGPL
jgi:predicted ABC-type transport system involved in lysophospholipase L1 biosynthesis ATPase subunit